MKFSVFLQSLVLGVVNGKFKSARLMYFLQAQDFLSQTREIKALRRYRKKILDSKTCEIWLKLCKKHIF